MIAHTSYAFPVARRRRLRGFGQIPADTAALVANPQYSTQPNVGAQPTTTFTLDSYMAEWAAASIAFPSALAGADPMSEAVAVAQSYCAAEHVSDCGNLGAIASKYGAQVKAALAGSPPATSSPCGTGMVWDGAACKPAAGGSAAATTTGTTYSQQNQSSQCGTGMVWDGAACKPAAGGSSSGPPASPGPGWVWDGTAWRYAGSSTVVNPSPASQPTTDGSSLTAPGSLLSLANGASVTTGQTTPRSADIIPGIPNAAIFLGAAAAVGLLVLGMQR